METERLRLEPLSIDHAGEAVSVFGDVRLHTWIGGATLHRSVAGRIEADLAWVVGYDYQRLGYGREGALAMAAWLRARGVEDLVAYVHPGHDASVGIARAVGLTAKQALCSASLPGRSYLAR